MEHNYCVEYKGLLIRPMYECDIELLRKWRNDKELSKYLTPIGQITKEMQIRWYKNYLKDNDIIFFSIVDRSYEKVIGSVPLYDFENDACEVGKIVLGNERGEGKGYISLLMAIYIAIRERGIYMINLRVCEENKIAYNLYKKVGFVEMNRHSFVGGGSEIKMVITKNDFLNNNIMVNDFKIFKDRDFSIN